MEFIDLGAQYRAYQTEIDAAMARVVSTSRFINGAEVTELEQTLARFVGVDHAVAISSGTEALRALLMAWNIGPGDEVITTPFTFIATAEVIALVGATPVFVDIEPDTLNLDASLVEAAITPRTRALLPVSLYGQCPDLDTLNAIASHHRLPVLEDACQSLGAGYQGKRSCGLTTAAATSFFPAKPLGCFGDGGMIFTSDADLARQTRLLRDHGQSMRYHHDTLGFNGRFDTLQAAVLLAKLPHFEAEIAARQQAADYYRERLAGRVGLVTVRPGRQSVHAQFTVRVPDRERVREVMTRAGIPTAVHYPIPLHQQPVFAHLNQGEGSFPHAEQASREVLSLPMHPFLTRDEQDQVIAALLDGVAGS